MLFLIRFHLLSLLLLPLPVIAQVSDTVQSTSLETVIIKSYEQGRSLTSVPAAINYVSPQMFDRSGPVSIVMAINSTPGIRMEERSPGSYRINIRGSGLRSPFGVRNVKIYFNDIPVTDPGGNSFFNQLSPSVFSSLEIIKGPASSMYGAGTGGALIISSRANYIPSASVQYDAGSYGLQQLTGKFSIGEKNSNHQVSLQIQNAEGYRRHSEMERKTFAWTGDFSINKHSLQTMILLGDHFYQTPGALRENEFDLDPRMARPGSPGAVENNASIRQRTFIAGATWNQFIRPNFQNRTTAYGMFTQVTNPAIRNYGTSSEPHTGIRTVFNYIDSNAKSIWAFVLGGEWQAGFPNFQTYKNNSGQKDSLLWFDEVNNRQHFIFSQASLEIDKWKLIVGSSINNYVSGIERFSPASTGKHEVSFTKKISSSIAISRLIGKGVIYSGISKGFSPPGIAEINPTGSALNTSLKPEDGVNYDLGFRIFSNGVSMDVNAFLFSLDNSIVLRRDSAGGDYYINSGRTKQKGIETAFNYPFLFPGSVGLSGNLWFSHTWHTFRYKNFIQLETDYSGKRLPGISPVTIATGMSLKIKNGLFADINYYYSDAIPLNDANSAFGPDYHLVGLRFGYEKNILDRLALMIRLGVENLFDEVYSLGYDINGFGGRYFNAAPGRNYIVSIRLETLRKK